MACHTKHKHLILSVGLPGHTHVLVLTPFLSLSLSLSLSLDLDLLLSVSTFTLSADRSSEVDRLLYKIVVHGV